MPRKQTKKQIRKRIHSIISVVLTTAFLVSFYPADLMTSPSDNYTNIVQADENGPKDTATSTDAAKDSQKKDSEKKDSSSSSAALKKSVLENDDIAVEGILPVDAVMESKRVDVKIDGKDALIAYDINIYASAADKKAGIKWQPEDDPLTVTFKTKSIEADSVDVYHLEDKKSPAELVEENVSTDDNQVEFEADSFSIYAIVEHEGDDDIKTPRFTIEFLAPVSDPATQGYIKDGVQYYNVGPYEFKNKNNDIQKTQIVQNGETLEMIANPPNLPGEYFFGWYVVDPAPKEEGEEENENELKFSWPESPKKITFDTPISVANNGDGTFTMTWTVEGKTYSETAEYDPDDYSAHIYVAPIYEDYCFVNFHELAYAVSSNSNLLTRKLVILGSDETEKVLISDVTAQATDTIRKIFRGWQYRANNTWISVQTMNDNGNPITKYIDITGDTDLFPYFQEGRWLYFNVGDSGNGATYVPAQFTLAEFDSEEGSASVGGTVDSLPTTTRAGYDFGGWRVNTGTDDNPNYVLVTDPDGNFLDSVNLSINETYLDNDGNEQTGVAYTIQNGELTIKYPLSSLTFYAEWIEKTDTHFTVVVWKQKVTDEANLANADKDYDYYVLPADIPSTIDCTSGLTVAQINNMINTHRTLTTNSDATIRNAFTGFHLRDTDPVVMDTPTVRGDGSTVVNVYYDRNVHNLDFQVQDYTYTVSNNDNDNNPAKYGDVNGQKARVYWRNGAFRVTDNNNAAVYTGTVYTRSNNQSWQTIKTITALYEHNISNEFPITGTNGVSYDQGQRWAPQNSSTYTQVLVYLDIMPNEDIRFRLDNTDKELKYLYYYIEPLPDTPAAPEDRTYNGKRFILYHLTRAKYGFFTEAEDYLDLIGFTKDTNSFPPQAYNSSGTQVNQVWGSGSNAESIYCYYLRDSYTLSFDYNYPVASGVSNKITDITDVPYESPLSSYEFTPDASDIPDHYEFIGWFEDQAGTKPFDFNSTMPAADKIIYGKWEPVYYNVCIDPNGGVINHINYSEPTDGGYPTFYAQGLASENGAAWDAARAAVGGDTSWVSSLPGSGHNTSQSTYFSAMYGTAIGEYELERVYVECDASDEGTKYYYVNMQYNNNGEWGLHADMRNALYLTEAQLEAYYKYCLAAKAWHDVSRPGYYDGTIPSTFDEFKNTYVKKNGQGEFQLYKESVNSSYAFVGWYVVNPDGTLSDTPYSFANAIENSITLRAVWRRVGDYYISYDPTYVLTLSDGTEVLMNGQISAWTDPANSAMGKYNDGATTTTLQQPTGITANGVEAGEDYIFRGWEVVDYLGIDENGHAIYRPRYNNVYYAEPTTFVINSVDADSHGCIHMRAVYQAVNESDRRPEIANLMLNANDGHLVDASENTLSSDIDITTASGWTGTGVVVEDESENEIVFGNMQSNDAVHVYKYAVTNGSLDSPYDQSTNYFKHDEGYLLIGFDEGSDYTFEMTAGDDSDNLKTGEPYIPTYASDSVISVQRTDSEKLYAVWEPMVYVDFTNRTSQPVTFTLSGSGQAMSIVNEVTGLFSREKFTETVVTLQPGETIKFVMPKGAGETFTVDGTNTNTAQLLNVTSFFDGNQTASALADRSSHATYTLTDTLHTDSEGVHVYFDGIDTIFYDVNGGNWTDTRTGNSYQQVADDASLIYVDEDGLPYEPVDLSGNNTATATKPSDPTRTGYTFVGWTSDPDVAACDPAGYTLPGTDESAGINNMTIIKRDKLWNFDTEVDAGMTLYAVWGENVTVTFHLTNDHTWHDTDNEYFVPGNNRTYTVTLAKGDTVRMPTSPTWNASHQFYRWSTVDSHQNASKTIDQITNIYDFGTPVLSNTDLYTSWINADHIDVTISKTVENGDGSDLTTEQLSKEFSFTAKVVTTYSKLTVTRSGSNWSGYNYNTELTETSETDSQTYKLKDGESFTISLYYDESEQTGNVNSSTARSATIFFQSLVITETSDPNYTVKVKIDNQPEVETDSEIINSRNSNPSWIYNNNRNYTLSASPTYPAGTEVPIAFTNTRTKTDVKLTKVVTHDDYITGDEEFVFENITYKNDQGNTVTTPAEYTTATLKNGESVILRGVPIGGSITVTENAPGWTAESVNDADDTDTDGATFTLSQVPSEGGGITFTNTRNTSDITVKNNVLSDEYGDKTKNFTYTATLWNGDTQVPFPSTITDATFSDGRKVMTFTLKDDETRLIKDLPNGYKLVVTQTADEDYTTAVGLEGEAKASSLEYTITDIQNDAVIEFENTLKTGTIKVTKNVQLPAGHTLPPGTTFNFTAKLYPTSNSTTASPISNDLKAALNALNRGITFDDTANTFSFTLGDGEDISLPDLPVGYFLQVKETAPGYAAYVNTIRTDAVTVLIAETGNSDINYINRKAASTITIKKVDKVTGNPVKGAVFRLYNVVNGTQNTLYTLTSDDDGWLAYTESGDPVTEISLENGTYYLAEQTPAKWYKLLEDSITITVDNSDPDPANWVTVSGSTAVKDFEYLQDEDIHTFKVTNERAPIIIPTGVNVAFNFLSIALILAMGLWLFLLHKLSLMRRRREEED
ncbi:MAG: InlB B-repeat-containing protein [Eubacterium sp.]|nr:InlB B-repeat-containing protein [Eubacterium sp.]